MKRILFFVLFIALAMTTVFAQDTGTQQQIDKLSGQIQDLLAAQEQQGKQIAALQKDISELRDKASAPAPDAGASADDLKSLAEKVQEIDKKRQADRDLILKQIENLGKVSGGSPSHKPKPVADTPATSGGDNSTAPVTPQKGYEYPVKEGDTLGLIVKAYRDQGVKVTTSQIIKANPKMNPNVLIPGQKIFIPDPNAK